MYLKERSKLIIIVFINLVQNVFVYLNENSFNYYYIIICSL
jgi:hypothetical protein